MRACRLLLIAFIVNVVSSFAVAEEWFAPSKTVAGYRPKGPEHCYRQFNIDWSWIGRGVAQLPEFLSQADAVRLAEFCQEMNIDGTVVMAVPHHGYCTYDTRVGTRFPGMQGDWFGRTIDELHRRRIAAFGYITLNWNWKYMRAHLGQDYIEARAKPDGSLDGMICLNAPGYVDLVEAYTPRSPHAISGRRPALRHPLHAQGLHLRRVQGVLPPDLWPGTGLLEGPAPAAATRLLHGDHGSGGG